MLTSDLDFGTILAATRGLRPSVIQLRSEVPIAGVIGAAVVAAIEQAQRELNEGALVSVDLARARLRVLPLRG